MLNSDRRNLQEAQHRIGGYFVARCNIEAAASLCQQRDAAIEVATQRVSKDFGLPYDVAREQVKRALAMRRAEL